MTLLAFLPYLLLALSVVVFALVVLIALLVGMRTNRTWAFMAFYGFYYVVQSLFNTHYWNYAADYFDAVVAAGTAPKAAANWMTGEFSRLLNQRAASGLRAGAVALRPAGLAELIGVSG